MNEGEALSLLREALGDSEASFRGGQWEAIDAVLNHKQKCLIVQRTGWGKSTVYFIATRILRDRDAGPTLIVSPLLALMRNQIDAAKLFGLKAATINCSNRTEWDSIEEQVRIGALDVLLISPERLANESFSENVLSRIANRLGLLVIDEAHCISDWGHDFRPDYQRLSNILRRIPDNTPVICTTATANNRVISDIRSQLGELSTQRGPLMRTSLELQTLRLQDQAGRLAWLADHLESLPGTGIIYTLTKRDAEQVTRWLQSEGVTAEAYHSAVQARSEEDPGAVRASLEDRLLRNELKALVATTALGMGYDKPDLGFVVHYQAPGSVIAYYQQVGRAGRAIDRAVGILLAGGEDDRIQEFDWRMDHDRIARLTGQREREWAELQAYIDHPGCLMAYLAQKLDDPAPMACGRCASCRGEPIIPETVQHKTAVRAAGFLRHSEFEIQPKKQVATGAFEIYGWRGNIPLESRLETGRVLARWGDAGWGQMVAVEKENGHFSDELVAASAEMILERWGPTPFPEWVTCIPSQRHPDLVPDFARRLAAQLKLPWLAVIEKSRDNQPQKEQQNRYHQCRNLDNAFELTGEIPAGAVLLIDDVHDSGWTLTVGGILLRSAGSGPVFPLALASAGPGE